MSGPAGSSDVRLTLAAALDEREVGELWPVYDAIFPEHVDLASWCEAVWDRHAARDGFRLARAHDAARLVGFGYGFTGQPGQWWTDRAAEVLGPDLAAEWLGGHFELVSIGVLPAARGRGVGRRLLDTLTAGLPHERWLLMTTADADDPARRLYAATGWSVVGPGLEADQVIMGRQAAGQVTSGL